MVADEPTGNLHTSQGDEIMELFKKLNSQGATIIQVTHSERNAAYGDRVIEIRDGWIEKNLNELFANYRNRPRLRWRLKRRRAGVGKEEQRTCQGVA